MVLILLSPRNLNYEVKQYYFLNSNDYWKIWMDVIEKYTEQQSYLSSQQNE